MEIASQSLELYLPASLASLKPGIPSTQAEADLLVLSRQLQRAYPKFNKETESALFPATLLPVPFRGYVVAFTGLLMAVVALVLLIACANVTNLLLAHALQRRREMAIRSSLGARRARLIRQTLTESGLLSCLAGGMGVVLALWMIPLILKLMPPNLPIRLDIPLDARVLGFTLLLSLLIGVILGLVPALQGSKLDLVGRL